MVVCRGENLHASGLILLTPLAVEVHEGVASGRVRTTVKDLLADEYLNEVHVKVIGSRNEDFVSGATDLRGVFIADGIQGTSTVIAQADPALYAFFRGTKELAPQPAEGKPQAADKRKEPEHRHCPCNPFTSAANTAACRTVMIASSAKGGRCGEWRYATASWNIGGMGNSGKRGLFC